MEVIFDTEEIEDHLYFELIQLGYVPEEAELQDLAEIVFSFLVSKLGGEELVDDSE